MLCYVAVRMVELYERDTSPHKQQTTGRKKKSNPAGDEPRMVGGVLASGKQRIVCLLSQLSELEIVCLWDPPSIQMMENWSGLVAQLCYKLLVHMRRHTGEKPHKWSVSIDRNFFFSFFFFFYLVVVCYKSLL